MKLSNLYESLLMEKVYGGYATVYHRTSVQDLANKIYTSGFKPGSGDMYGKGFYATYDLESQMKPNMAQQYGYVLVKFAVPILNFVIFDYDTFVEGPLSKKIKDYDESNFLFKQLDHFGMEYDRDKISDRLYDPAYTSDTALNCVSNIPDFTKKCDGIIFTGRRDGKVLVCYNTRLVLPLSFRERDEGEFTKVTDKNLDYLKRAWTQKLRTKVERDQAFPEEYGLERYIERRDGKIDVLHYVDFSHSDLKEIPFRFGKVEGNFLCQGNDLKSLEGSPEEVVGDYNCSYNHYITSLKGAPNIVHQGFYCRNNDIESLVGGPKIVKGYYACHYCALKSLEGAPIRVRDFNCYDNTTLTTLKGGPKVVVASFNCEGCSLTSLEGAPRRVGGAFNCANNELTSLKGIPKYVGGDFICDRNPRQFTEEEIRAVCTVEGRVIT